jgi:hypothetical protein
VAVVLQASTCDKEEEKQEKQSLAGLQQHRTSQPHPKRKIFEGISNMVLQSASKRHLGDVKRDGAGRY